MAERAVIFDLDGTIWDSWPHYAAVLADLSGQPLNALLEALHGGESVARLHERLKISRRRFVNEATRDADQPPLYDNVRDVLLELKEAGNALGIVTSLPGSIANPLLAVKGLKKFFDVVIPAKFGVPAKPNPKGLITCLGDLEVREPSRAFYVGDAASDGEAARGAGTRFAWASYGYFGGPVECDLLLQRPADLLSL